MRVLPREVVIMKDYMAGRRYGACDFRAGVFQPQAFAGEPADFRQGYVDGWEDAADTFVAAAVSG